MISWMPILATIQATLGGAYAVLNLFSSWAIDGQLVTVLKLMFDPRHGFTPSPHSSLQRVTTRFFVKFILIIFMCVYMCSYVIICLCVYFGWAL
jgi:hypothetical protein